MSAPVRVDSYLDVSCPWCYVTRRHLQDAITDFGAADVRVVRHPYQIDGEQPAAPMPMLDWLAGKYGRSRAQRMSEQVTDYARRMGITLANEAGFAADTLAAHRLLWLAGREYDERTQSRLEELLFAAYFSEAACVADHGVLTDRAVRAGLAADRVQRFLATGEGVPQVRALVARARQETAVVPYIVIDGRLRLRDTQDKERLLHALQRAAKGEDE